MIINRFWAMPNKWTFQIEPIKQLLKKYKVGNGWIDPFAGMYSPAEITNDINPAMNAKHYLESKEFAEKILNGDLYNGCLFDPPYSLRQIMESYKGFGKAELMKENPAGVYTETKNIIAKKIKQNGYAFSCGWSSNGFGKSRGFKLIEILLVAHGGHHNDTIVTVEQKIDGQIDLI